MAVDVVAAFVVASLAAHCAPFVGARTIRAIIAHESAFEPFAIGDNATGRSYDPPDHDRAVRLATSLVDRGHDIDLGYMQVNIGNVRSAGLDISHALDPCTNVRLGATVLQRAYARAEGRFGAGQVALANALSAYNSGGYGRLDYARAVYACAAEIARKRIVVRATP